MSEESVNLSELILTLEAADDDDLDDIGIGLYEECFLNRSDDFGMLLTHDGLNLKFFGDRYHHAFHTSPNRARQAYSKAKVSLERVERIKWVQPIVEGRVKGVECWEVPYEGHRPFPGKRAYICWEHTYIVWVEPTKDGSFKFSSAYPCSRGDLGRYTRVGRKLQTF